MKPICRILRLPPFVSIMSGFVVYVVSHQLVKDGDSVEKVTFSATCTSEPESSISGDITTEVRFGTIQMTQEEEGGGGVLKVVWLVVLTLSMPSPRVGGRRGKKRILFKAEVVL